MNIKLEDLINLHKNNNFYEIYKRTNSSINEYKNDFISLKIISNASLKTKNYQDAINFSNLAIKLNDCDYEIYLIIANSQNMLLNYDSALLNVKKSIKLNKQNILALNLLGITYLNLNDTINAEKTFKELTELAPEFFEGCFNLALLYYNLQNFQTAEKVLLKIKKINQDHEQVNFLLAVCRRELGKYDLSLEDFNNILKQNYNNDICLFNIAKIYESKKNISKAINYLQQAIKINDKNEDYYNALGVCYYNSDNLKEAERIYLITAKLFPNSKTVFHNLGILYYDLNKFDEADKFLDKNLKINPGYPDSKFAKSAIYLSQGRFDVGWEFYRWRIRGKYYDKKFISQFSTERLLKISDAYNKTVLIRYEQGKGDIFQFSRYLKLLLKEDVMVIFLVPKVLEQLLKTIDNRIIVINKLNLQYKYDYFCMLLDLPKIFKTETSTIPSFKSYIHASGELVKKWSIKIDKKKLNIGIFWQGSTKPVDKGRSCKLEYFSKISKLKNIQLISLQKNFGSDQISEFKQNNQILDFTSEIDLNNDFMDTAAIIKNLDLVITVDSSIPHLAGALGAKVWVLLKFTPDWRWIHKYDKIDKASKTRWYPNMRLYKQSKINDWSNVFENIFYDIKNFTKN